MKKYLLLSFLFFNFYQSIAQITLDTTITPWDGFGYSFYPVQISNTETKYLISDTISNTFNLYNMDFTPFVLNVSVPEPFRNSTGTYKYEVIYVSRSIFDCDSSNIEYAYSVQGGGGTKPFYIMRTDGTQLFRLDSTIAPWCLGCLSGSHDIRPIRNTSAGTKLFLSYPTNSQTIRIYSLCGTLTESVFDFTNANLNHKLVKIFPNPSSGFLTFQINIIDNRNDYELVIVDTNGKELRREKINSANYKYIIDASNFSCGTYYYSLCTKDKSFESGKFILTK